MNYFIYISHDFTTREEMNAINFGILVLNRVSYLSFFILIRVSVYQFLSYTGYLFLDDEQQNFYKLLLINIDFR